MKGKVMAVFIPPIAICRYGCASCCAAPIGVFWITGIVSIIYAFFGGPAATEGISWGTLGLGLIMWGIAAVWAENVIQGVDDDGDTKCETKSGSLCRLVQPDMDDTDPLEEVKKFHH